LQRVWDAQKQSLSSDCSHTMGNGGSVTSQSASTRHVVSGGRHWPQPKNSPGARQRVPLTSQSASARHSAGPLLDDEELSLVDDVVPISDEEGAAAEEAPEPSDTALDAELNDEESTTSDDDESATTADEETGAAEELVPAAELAVATEEACVAPEEPLDELVDPSPVVAGVHATANISRGMGRPRRSIMGTSWWGMVGWRACGRHAALLAAPR